MQSYELLDIIQNAIKFTREFDAVSNNNSKIFSKILSIEKVSDETLIIELKNKEKWTLTDWNKHE